MAFIMALDKNLLVSFAACLSLCGFTSFARASISSGGDLEMENSVIDNGGGTNLEGGDYTLKASVAQISLPGDIGLSNGGGYVNRTGFYNPPYFTYQSGLPTTFAMASEDANLSFPADSIDKRTFDITLNKDPLGRPLVVDPGKINDAIQKIVGNEGRWAQPVSNNLAEIAIFDEQDYYSKPLARKGLLTMRYSDADNNGIVDGSNPPVRANTLTAWGLDETRNTWVELPAVSADPGAHTLTSYFEMPGVYAMLGSRDLSISRNFKAYPVPFRPNGPQAGDGAGQTGTEASGITFENAPQSGDIEIYTIDGRLARKLPISDNLAFPYRVKWDVKTTSGDRAASGVYIWRVNSGTTALTGKLMVIW
jgi:hypothetical protein